MSKIPVVRPTVAQTLSLFSKIRKTGSIFEAEFVKNDGTIRQMHCRMGVKRYLKGGSLGYNASEKGLLPVYDLEKKAYRVVNLNTIRTLTHGGIKYAFSDASVK